MKAKNTTKKQLMVDIKEQEKWLDYAKQQATHHININMFKEASQHLAEAIKIEARINTMKYVYITLEREEE